MMTNAGSDETINMASAQGDAVIVDAQLALGQMALDRGDTTAALEWFRAAGRSGDRRAWNMLGRCAERGWGMARDAKMAVAYFRRAADMGDAWAMFNLADLLVRGDGVERDPDAALALYVEAARLGHVKSLNMIGLLYEDGHLGASERHQARSFFKAGAEGGDCWAQFNYARHLIEDGAIAEAQVWLEKTLETGFPDFWQQCGAMLAEHADPRLRAYAARALALAQRVSA